MPQEMKGKTFAILGREKLTCQHMAASHLFVTNFYLPNHRAKPGHEKGSETLRPQLTQKDALDSRNRTQKMLSNMSFPRCFVLTQAPTLIEKTTLAWSKRSERQAVQKAKPKRRSSRPGFRNAFVTKFWRGQRPGR
jgi:hypothetical protein